MRHIFFFLFSWCYKFFSVSLVIQVKRIEEILNIVFELQY